MFLRRTSPEADIRSAVADVEPLMAQAFAAVHGVPEADSSLDQAGLSDGGSIIAEYLHHGEARLALEHLIYMIYEPPLRISSATFALIERAGLAMQMPPTAWEAIRPVAGA